MPMDAGLSGGASLATGRASVNDSLVVHAKRVRIGTNDILSSKRIAVCRNETS